MFRFEKLDVWQKGISLADLVYSVTQSFPDYRTVRTNESNEKSSSFGLFKYG